MVCDDGTRWMGRTATRGMRRHRRSATGTGEYTATRSDGDRNTRRRQSKGPRMDKWRSQTQKHSKSQDNEEMSNPPLNCAVAAAYA